MVSRLLKGAALLIFIASLSIYLNSRRGVVEVPPAEEPVGAIGGKLERGETLSELLSRKEVSPELSSVILDRLGQLQNLRRCQPGDSFYLEFSGEGAFQYFEYVADPAIIYVVRRSEEGIESYRKEVQVDTVLCHIWGVVNSCLYESIVSLGESPELAFAFADIFSWVVDFTTEVRKGDGFGAVLAKHFVGGEFAGYGRILVAEYRARRGPFYAFYFRDPDGHEDYYDLKGKSVRRMFLRAPLSYRRISSYFSHRRLHPILKVYRPHYGVDYAAPTGTPVSAAGDGVVIFCGWKGGYGKLIRIRHPNSFMTEYGHLSRFAKGMRKGKRVKQEQVIGYVGSTGLSTGPHLQYGMKRYGRYVNPLKVNPPAADPVKKKYFAMFDKRKAELFSLLKEWDFVDRAETYPRIGS